MKAMWRWLGTKQRSRLQISKIGENSLIVNFIIPGDINLPTGGYRYDKRIIREWEKIGIHCNLISLKGDFPFPTSAAIDDAVAKIAELPQADICVVDGLAGGAMPQFMQQLSTSSPVVALVHHPLYLESGLDVSDSAHLKQKEQDGLAHVCGVVTTSPTTSRTVKDFFEIDPGKITTVVPGVARGKLAKPHIDGPIQILCIGSLIERKGHRYLIDALKELIRYDWTLDCFGMQDEASCLFKEINQMIEAHQLSNRITLHGNVSDRQIEEAYSTAHLFVLPSLFEGYGMAYAEAIVRGLPVIGTTAGAIPETVPEACGILVEPENTEELREALEKLLIDKDLLEKYRIGAVTTAEDFPTWESSAVNFKGFLEQYI